MLADIVAGRWINANGVITLLPANAVGDDIEIYTDESRTKVALTWHNLRQQNERPPGKPNYCLADFVAPKSSGVRDYLGAFAVTAGIGIERKLAEFAAKNDDYGAIMLTAPSVSGFYFSHPDARYFAVGRIGDDQVADYAARTAVERDAARARLAPNLA